LIVDVQNSESLGSNNCLDVMSIDALAKLAERFNAMILHMKKDHLHEYFVQAGGTTYRFTLIDTISESIVPANEATHQESES
jgi:hypothetical protein